MTRKMPAPRGTGTFQNTAPNGYTHRSRVEPLGAEERAVRAAVELLQEHGYGIAMRCLDCQHPITTVASLERMRGPRCAAKAVNGND